MVALLLLTALGLPAAPAPVSPSRQPGPPGPPSSLPADPDRTEAALRQALARGRPIVLIGETSPPKWYRWDLGQGVFCPSSLFPKDDCFSIQSLHESLLTLLKEDRLRKGYWLRAEVRHNNGLGISSVGLHFGYSNFQAARGPEHFQVVFAFADSGRLAGLFPGPGGTKLSQAGIRLHFFREPGVTPGLGSNPDTRLRKLYDPNKGGPWRRLAVRVAPEGIRIFWQGELIGEMSRAELVEKARKLLGPNANTDPGLAFGPDGALGLYICSGEASFQRVVVEPLE
jgi:hypothetical protein